MSCRICDAIGPKAAAVALARWGLGMLLLCVGVGKFYSQGVWGFKNLGEFVNGFLLQDKFRETFLPRWLLTPYGYCLPFAEMLLGVLLLTGLGRNPVLLATGLLMLSLVFGAIVMKDWTVTFENMFYLCVVAGLLFLDDHDRWRLPCLCGGGNQGQPGPCPNPTAGEASALPCSEHHDSRRLPE